jgi:hypothetical protein
LVVLVALLLCGLFQFGCSAFVLFMALGEQIGVRDTFLALDRAFDDLMIEIGI